MNGILNLNKPPGITSHDCVARIRRAAKMKRVGHAGTLDPMATGVLLVCLGQATRLSEYLMGGRKVYRAEITFGITTDTQDSSGRPLEENDASGVTPESIAGLLPRFTGDQLQVPPMVSALHYEGKRLYNLARQGIEVERAPRPVTIYRLDLLHFTPGEHPKVVVDVECSPGTYIRTLAHDLGAAAGCGAHMSALERRASGAFRVEEAVTLEAAEEQGRAGTFESLLSPMKTALAGRPLVEVSPEQVDALKQGRALSAPKACEGTDLVGLTGPGGDLVALARPEGELLRPFKVLLGA